MSEIRYYTDGEQATAATLNRPLEDLNNGGQYMSKVQFEALAADRREKFAGSGFVKGFGLTKTFGNWKSDSASTSDYLVAGSFLTTFGTNKLLIPTTNHEVIANLSGTALTINTGNSMNFAALPEANTSVPVITDSTNMSEMKQGDMAILKDLNREWMKDGDFSEGSIQNPYDNGRSSVSISNNKLKVYTDNAEKNGYIAIHIPTVSGCRYKVSFDIEFGEGCLKARSMSSSNSVKTILNVPEAGTYTYEFIGDGSSYNRIHFYTYTLTDSDNSFILVDNISVKQVEDQIVAALEIIPEDDLYNQAYKLEVRNSVSRQDLVFLEMWHENISEKGLVYPYGNVQYIGSNKDGLSGIQEGSFSGSGTYSLFGTWMQDEGKTLVGKGYIWDNLSNTDKLKFANNKDNNIYKDGDIIVQVRYRVRVIKGNDNKNTLIWNAYIGDYPNNPKYYNTKLIPPQGKQIKPISYGYSNGRFIHWDKNTQEGVFNSTGSYMNSSDITYGSRDRGLKENYRSIPIALVQRRNIGAYDPVFNSDGSAMFSDGKQWFETQDSRNSTADCFNNKSDSTIGNVSGRPDGLFSDEVNYKDISDLRMSARKRPVKELFEEYNNKAIAGEIMGKESNRFSIGKKIESSTYTCSGGVGTGNNGYGETIYAGGTLTSGNGGKGFIVVYSDEGFITAGIGYIGSYYLGFNYVNGQNPKSLVIPMVKSGKKITIDLYAINSSTYIFNDTLTHTDIIGDPRKLSERVKYTVIDGTEQTVDLKVNDYVLNDDGKYYRNLVERDAIDLDTDDFTSVTNWLNLGSDGTIGGYKDQWLENGIQGSPLLVGENGESLLLIDDIRTNSTRYLIKSSKKRTSGRYLKAVATKKDGTLMGLTDGDQFDQDTTENLFAFNKDLYLDLGYASEQEMLDLMIVLVTYETDSNFLELANNSKVLEIGEVSSYSEREHKYGSKFGQNLIGKIFTGGHTDSLKLKPDYAINVNKLHTSYNPVHKEITKVDHTSALKVLPYLSESYSKAKLHYVFKELKFDDTNVNEDGSATNTWGDDNQFQITNKVSYVVDDNGNTVLYGQKSFDLPYFI